jgi:hypothetical protein
MTGQNILFSKAALYSIFAVFLTCASAVLFLHDPASAGGVYPPCPFHAATGLHCPGCGTLRSLHQILHLNLWQAIRFNVLTVLVLFIFVFTGILRVVADDWRRRFLGRPVFLFSIRFLPVVVTMFWIFRNIPVEPLSWLAPH